MSNKTPAILSTVLTVITLIVMAVLSVFTQMLVLNGASENQGMTAMGISLGCQGVGIILAGILTWWLANSAVNRWHWNKVIAVLVAIVAGITVGVVISVISVIIAIPVAGIK
jgi:MFS family permease